jgi:two-component system cell cycle response regulator
VAPSARTTVLVADDSATVRALVRLELESAGYAVVEAKHGLEALDVARAGGVDVVLLDVEMPVLDGFGTIKALKADASTSDLPVVFLTSRSDSENIVEALRLGAHDYLRKSPEPAELLARVGAAAQVTELRAELRRRSEELERMSRTDHLTGLANRRSLDAELSTLAGSSRPYRYPITVLLVDVDHFKRVNDTLGHGAGDVVLVEVARRLASCVRGEDAVGRWGGEEFLVLAPNTDVAGAEILAERLRRVVADEPVEAGSCALEVHISVGGATAPMPGVVADALLRVADANLYAVKEAGRNGCRVGTVPAV